MAPPLPRVFPQDLVAFIEETERQPRRYERDTMQFSACPPSWEWHFTRETVWERVTSDIAPDINPFLAVRSRPMNTFSLYLARLSNYKGQDPLMPPPQLKLEIWAGRGFHTSPVFSGIFVFPTWGDHGHLVTVCTPPATQWEIYAIAQVPPTPGGALRPFDMQLQGVLMQHGVCNGQPNTGPYYVPLMGP